MPIKENYLIRTFIAIEIPDSIKLGMKDIQAELMKTHADVAWVRPDGIHLTLKFLGEVEADAAGDIASAVEEAAKGVQPFPLEVKGVGVFPTPRSPRVVWLGLSGGMDALAELHQKIERACEGLGFTPDGRPFKPHLTLGRVKSPKGREALVKALAAYERADIGTFEAASVSVMKSELRPAGAIYSEIHKIIFSK